MVWLSNVDAADGDPKKRAVGATQNWSIDVFARPEPAAASAVCVRTSATATTTPRPEHACVRARILHAHIKKKKVLRRRTIRAVRVFFFFYFSWFLFLSSAQDRKARARRVPPCSPSTPDRPTATHSTYIYDYYHVILLLRLIYYTRDCHVKRTLWENSRKYSEFGISFAWYVDGGEWGVRWYYYNRIWAVTSSSMICMRRNRSYVSLILTIYFFSQIYKIVLYFNIWVVDITEIPSTTVETIIHKYSNNSCKKCFK